MNKGTVAAPVGIVFFAVAGLVAAQTPSSETARKHLESGVQFYEQAQYKQALNDFEIVVSMADPTYADDALLKIGTYYLEIEEDYPKAREYFSRILQDYPTTDAAPGAYYYIGLVTMRSGSGPTALDDAIANFQRVVRLYPGSLWVPAALDATGAVLEREGAWQEAIDSYFRVTSEYPDSRWAAGAQLALGRCSVRLGDSVQGMIEIQRVRQRYPDTPEAEEALDCLTHLFRLYGYPHLGQPVTFRIDSSFRPALSDKFKDVEAVKISANGIHLLERGRKRVLIFDWTGRLAATKAAVDPRGLSIDSKGVMVVANEKGLMVAEKPLVLTVREEKGPKPLENIRAAVRDRLGDFFVYDDKEKKVLRFDSSGQLKGSFPDASQNEILRLELDNRGNVVMLEKKNRSVAVFAPDGRRIARIERQGDKWELGKPTDFAVDPAGYFYLLDEDRPQIVVFDPSYEFVTALAAPNLGGGVLEKPIALDVSSSGDVYVYDDDAKTLLRFH